MWKEKCMHSSNFIVSDIFGKLLPRLLISWDGCSIHFFGHGKYSVGFKTIRCCEHFFRDRNMVLRMVIGNILVNYIIDFWIDLFDISFLDLAEFSGLWDSQQGFQLGFSVGTGLWTHHFSTLVYGHHVKLASFTLSDLLLLFEQTSCIALTQFDNFAGRISREPEAHWYLQFETIVICYAVPRSFLLYIIMR